VTCRTDAQARDAIRKLHARNPRRRLIATGCYRSVPQKKLAALPGISWVVGKSHNRNSLVNGFDSQVPATESANGFVAVPPARLANELIRCYWPCKFFFFGRNIFLSERISAAR